jgi:hypothetical protein
MDRDPTHIVAHYLALSSVKASTDLESKRLHPPRHRAGAPDGPSGAVEGGEKPVSRRLDFTTSKSNEFTTNDSVVAIEKIPPPAVADRRRFSVAPTMSVKSTVARTRSGSAA